MSFASASVASHAHGFWFHTLFLEDQSEEINAKQLKVMQKYKQKG